jgi:Na+-transporting NADH:ubiquinone oxidoreductase subunit NqrD
MLLQWHRCWQSKLPSQPHTSSEAYQTSLCLRLVANLQWQYQLVGWCKAEATTASITTHCCMIHTLPRLTHKQYQQLLQQVMPTAASLIMPAAAAAQGLPPIIT